MIPYVQAGPASGLGDAGALAAFGGPWGLAIMGGSIASQAILAWISRRGQRKVAATQIVDEAERLLQDSLAAFQDGLISQSEALGNFDAVWRQVLASCGDQTLGDPGRRCISERQPGGQWDWFARYRAPIEAAPVSQSLFGGGYIQTADGQQPVGASPLLLIAAAALIGGGLLL